MKTLFFLILFFAGFPAYTHAMETNVDVALGDGSCLGMVIEKVAQLNSTYKVMTTGAVFRIEENEMHIYQGLSTVREISSVHWTEPDSFKLIVQNMDHVVFQGRGLTVAIYGDSTCVIRPDHAVKLKIHGVFKPEYIGRYQGELLMIDQHGGIDICSDRNRKDYPIEFLSDTHKVWKATYDLEKDERLMLAAFPARSFDWEKSYATNIVFTQAAQGGHYGQMPPEWLIRKWSQYFNIMVLWHNGLYIDQDKKTTYAGPYEIANPAELLRAIGIAHLVGFKVALYTSFYYFQQKHKSVEAYFREIKHLKDVYQIDGVYIDGLLTETSGHQNDQVFTNWEIIRRLRALFGADGVIVYHGTAYGHSAATMPQVDTYCDATLNGENVPFTSYNDPYIQYQVRKYGISNTVALWKPGPGPYKENERSMIDAVLNMHGRIRYWAGVTAVEPTAKHPQIWQSDIDENYRYYLRRLLSEKQARSGKRSTDHKEAVVGHTAAGDHSTDRVVPVDGMP